MWPEVDRARSENRHELVLGGADISQRLKKEGLDAKIFELIGLNYLDIHETSLENLPDNISKLSNLQSLVLHSNKFENFNINITRLEKLKLLDLSRNCLKEIPAEITNLSNIITFNFANNNLEHFPKLVSNRKLTVLDLSNNKLKTFPDVCYEELSNLSELKLTDNQIESIPPEIKNIGALKVLELGHNQIKVVPGELALCSKLKTLNLKNNPISDRRLLKLIDQCRIKQIIDYVKAHGPKSVTTAPRDDQKTTTEKDSDSDEDNYKHTIRVHTKDSPKIVVNESVKSVREFFVGCLVTNITFSEDSFKKFIQVQNKLHESVCSKRNLATIATHDFNKLVRFGIFGVFGCCMLNFSPLETSSTQRCPPMSSSFTPLTARQR